MFPLLEPYWNPFYKTKCKYGISFRFFCFNLLWKPMCRHFLASLFDTVLASHCWAPVAWDPKASVVGLRVWDPKASLVGNRISRKHLKMIGNLWLCCLFCFSLFVLFLLFVIFFHRNLLLRVGCPDCDAVSNLAVCGARALPRSLDSTQLINH